jgi:transcriptional regulator with XRE-family HTH domain
MENPSHSELADFLRSRRERLSPRMVGLSPGRRRRTPGLRREEVAELAGIGVDWYIRLEQGRSVSPSVTTVDALARALRLSKAEHGHLRALTRHADRRAFVRESVPGPLQRMVERLAPPAYITGRRWDVLAWNEAAPARGSTQHPALGVHPAGLAAPVRRRLARGGEADTGDVSADA